MTVDEILATGRYVDRRGREWVRKLFLRPNIHWANIIRDSDGTGWLGEKTSEDRMRLLIERDLHRDVCPGLIDCGDHPVPIVEIDGPIISGTGCYYVRGVKSWARVEHKHDLERAIDAARALAVGE